MLQQHLAVSPALAFLADEVLDRHLDIVEVVKTAALASVAKVASETLMRLSTRLGGLATELWPDPVPEEDEADHVVIDVPYQDVD